jgi:hypothetical protein
MKIPFCSCLKRQFYSLKQPKPKPSPTEMELPQAFSVFHINSFKAWWLHTLVLGRKLSEEFGIPPSSGSFPTLKELYLITEVEFQEPLLSAVSLSTVSIIYSEP